MESKFGCLGACVCGWLTLFWAGVFWFELVVGWAICWLWQRKHQVSLCCFLGNGMVAKKAQEQSARASWIEKPLLEIIYKQTRRHIQNTRDTPLCVCGEMAPAMKQHVPHLSGCS